MNELVRWIKYCPPLTKVLPVFFSNHREGPSSRWIYSTAQPHRVQWKFQEIHSSFSTKLPTSQLDMDRRQLVLASANLSFLFFAKMVKQTSSETAGCVLALRSLHLSYDKIKKQMFDDHILISRNAIIRIIKKNQCEQGSIPVNPRKFGFQNGRTVRFPALIRKVSVACAKRNPPTQRNLAARHGVSKATIWRILKEDLEWNARKKRKTHEVTPEQAVQRLERGHDFLEYLGKYKTRMIFTMDETYVTLNDFNGERDIYYQGKEIVV